MGGSAQYLLAIQALEPGDDARVSTGRIADHLGRSPAAATEMIQRLDADGLVDHESYAGVRLTGPGRARARKLQAAHRTLSRFFRDVLKLEKYEEALAVAGIIDPAVVARLEATLLPAEQI